MYTRCLMKFKTASTVSLPGLTLLAGAVAVAQQRNAGGQRNFPQPTPAKEVTVTTIPGVTAAGAQWKLVWQGPDKKVLYAKGAGMSLPDGTEYRTARGVRNNAKAIYKMDMIAQEFLGRAK